jgi:hypothetical protein
MSHCQRRPIYSDGAAAADAREGETVVIIMAIVIVRFSGKVHCIVVVVVVAVVVITTDIIITTIALLIFTLPFTLPFNLLVTLLVTLLVIADCPLVALTPLILVLVLAPALILVLAALLALRICLRCDAANHNRRVTTLNRGVSIAGASGTISHAARLVEGRLVKCRGGGGLA